jgi:NAD-dependent dihydropyrimidine dehydrogenase PreA subunit
MEWAKMTRLQETIWLEEAVTNGTDLHTTKGYTTRSRVNLYRIPWLRKLLENPWPQFLVRALTLTGFIFTITTALFGSRVGSHNFTIIMVWIAWWTTLKLGFIPFGGRSWCSICPIPLPGDWLQQGGILEKGRRKLGLNQRWPRHLKGTWLQSGGFLLIGLFSAVTLTDPHVTGWVLLALFGLAILMSLIFEHRAFCSYVCPIGGFSGLYAKAAPVEVRVVDKEICAKHGDKSCYQACPWGLYPLAFKDSSACGLCMECLRACPKDNLALNLRPYGNDLERPRSFSRLDETFLALTMLGSALAFSAVFIGPWGWLKSAAFEIGSRQWMVFAVGFLLLTLLFLPALFTLCVWLWKTTSQSHLPLKRLIADQGHGLLPLGLLAWIAFTISFALPKLNLVVGVLNDPFGWGWHLLNASNTVRLLDVSGFSPYLQVILLLIGIFWSANVTRKSSKSGGEKSSLLNIPVMAFYLAFSVAMLWLLVG